LGESFKSNRRGNNNGLRFQIYEKASFNIHLKVKKPDIPLGERRKGKKWGQIDIFNVMAKYKNSFQSIRQYAQYIWEVTLSEKMETKFWTAPSSRTKS
jgi:hypothetical protein